MLTIDEIRQVLILGAGTMGRQIGLQCAQYGYQVTLYDVQEQVLTQAMGHLRHILQEFVQHGRLSATAAESTLARIRLTTDPDEAAAQADLISESIPEDPVLKGKTLAQFHALCPPEAIFTTNSSTLLPSMFAAATGRPSQFCALHFHLPVWEANVVDIMPHPGTDTAVIPLLQTFARRIGQIPIVLQQEQSGYVFNTMLSALLGAANSLAARGIASPADIDRAWMGIMKTPIGPFGIQDAIGLQTVWQITDFWATVQQDAELKRNAAYLRHYLDQGHLGLKSGQGFYHYPEPAFAHPNFVRGSDE